MPPFAFGGATNHLCYNPTMATRSTPKWSEDEKQNAIELMMANGGNLKRVSTLTGIPRPTIRYWLEHTEAGTKALTASIAQSPALPGVASLPAPGSLNARGLQIVEKAAHAVELAIDRLIKELLDERKQWQLRDIAVAAGIMRDIHLDYRDGRRNATAVQVNNNSIQVTAEAVELIKAQARDMIIDAEDPPGS